MSEIFSFLIISIIPSSPLSHIRCSLKKTNIGFTVNCIKSYPPRLSSAQDEKSNIKEVIYIEVIKT